MTVDSKSYELAKYFLTGYDVPSSRVDDLAEAIQRTVEDFLIVHDEAASERWAEHQEKEKVE